MHCRQAQFDKTISTNFSSINLRPLSIKLRSTEAQLFTFCSLLDALDNVHFAIYVQLHCVDIYVKGTSFAEQGYRLHTHTSLFIQIYYIMCISSALLYNDIRSSRCTSTDSALKKRQG